MKKIGGADTKQRYSAITCANNQIIPKYKVKKMAKKEVEMYQITN
jgi:hypothetical protein